MPEATATAVASASSPAALPASIAAQQRSFQELLGSGRWDDLEKSWLEWIDRGAFEPVVARFVIEGLSNRGHDARAAVLCLGLLPRLQTAGRHADALEFCRRLLKLSPEEATLRTLFLTSYRAHYETRGNLSALLQSTGLEGVKPVPAAVADLDALLQYSEGDYFFHENGWGLGKVSRIDPDTMTLLLDFVERPNHKIPLRTAHEHFLRLPADDFRVLQAAQPEKLRELAEKEPLAMLEKVLHAYGDGITLKEVKAALVPATIKADGWSSWWNRLKKVLKQCSTIEVTSGASPRFQRREAPVSPAEELVIRVSHERELTAKLCVLHDGLRDLRRADGAVGGAEDLLSTILPKNAAPQSVPEALGLACALAELRPILGDAVPAWPTADALLSAPGADVLQLILNAGPEAYQREGLSALRRVSGPAWAPTAVQLLTQAEDTLRDAIAEMMRKEDTAGFAGLVHEIVSHPRLYPDAALWLVRTARGDKDVAELTGRDPLALCEIVAIAVDRLGEILLDGKDAVLKAQLQKGRSLFSARNFTDIRMALKEAPEDQLSGFWGHIRFNRGLSEQAKETVRIMLAERIPELVGVRTQNTTNEPQWIYTTAAGLAKRQKDLEHLVNTSMAENAKAIGKAMELGDLSENSEFTSALEQQGLLARKGEEMKAEFDRARLIDAAAITGLEVVIGTRVTAENIETHQVEQYTILGPWDVDAEHGIISYGSPLAQAFLEKKAGEIVDFVFGRVRSRYQVKEIHKAV